MAIALPFLGQHSPFPAVTTALAEPNGLLAYGGDLSVGRLLSAYSQGIFPWYSELEPILWWSPCPRAIIELDNFHASRSLRKLVRQKQYRVTMDHAFADVIAACASVPRQLPGEEGGYQDTWITKEMKRAYNDLHDAGFAHSVEVWDESTLVGGLYGVAIGQVFCGESMFHCADNASKLAMYALVRHMQTHNLAFIDCQMPTPHLSSLGATTLSRSTFIAKLAQHNHTLDPKGNILSGYRTSWRRGDITP
ncbi:leucyl/phenylalanyl-tRNA--protein transferase [Alteromonas halophila]